MSAEVETAASGGANSHPSPEREQDTRLGAQGLVRSSGSTTHNKPGPVTRKGAASVLGRGKTAQRLICVVFFCKHSAG